MGFPRMRLTTLSPADCVPTCTTTLMRRICPSGSQEPARSLVPQAEIEYSKFNKAAILTVGSGAGACREAIDRLTAQKVALNYCRVRAFPFNTDVNEFIEKHEVVYVVEQNRDAQLRTLLMLDCDADPEKLVPLLHYDGMPLNAGFVVDRVLEEHSKGRAA